MVMFDVDIKMLRSSNDDDSKGVGYLTTPSAYGVCFGGLKVSVLREMGSGKAGKKTKSVGF